MTSSGLIQQNDMMLRLNEKKYENHTHAMDDMFVNIDTMISVVSPLSQNSRLLL